MTGYDKKMHLFADQVENRWKRFEDLAVYINAYIVYIDVCKDPHKTWLQKNYKVLNQLWKKIYWSKRPLYETC